MASLKVTAAHMTSFQQTQGMFLLGQVVARVWLSKPTLPDAAALADLACRGNQLGEQAITPKSDKQTARGLTKGTAY